MEPDEIEHLDKYFSQSILGHAGLSNINLIYFRNISYDEFPKFF